MKYLDKETVEEAMAQIANGQFFSVVFEKQDESLRAMQAMKGVRKHLKGGVKTTNDEVNQTVFEKDVAGYRSFPKHKVVYLAFNGKELGVRQ